MQLRMAYWLSAVFTLPLGTSASAGLGTRAGRPNRIATAISGDGFGDRCEPDWDP